MSNTNRRHSICLSDIPPEPYPCETSYEEGSAENIGKEATLSVFESRSVSTPDMPLASSRTGTVAPVSAVPASDAAAAKKKKRRNRKKEKSIPYGQDENPLPTNGHTKVNNNGPSSPLIVDGTSLPHRVNGSSDVRLPVPPTLALALSHIRTKD